MPWISNPGSDRAVTCQRVNFRLEPDRVGASRRSVAEQRGDGRELSLRRPQRRLFYLEAAALLAGCPVNEAIPSPLTVARAELPVRSEGYQRHITTYRSVEAAEWSWSSLGTAGAVARAEAILHPGGSAARRAETQGVARTLRRDVLKFIARRKDVCVSANFLCSVSYRRRVVQLRVLFSSRFARSPSGVARFPGGRSPRPRCHFLLGLHHLTLCQTGVRSAGHSL